MAIQIAAVIMPIIKKVGMEVATEVAIKIAGEELKRQKDRLKNRAAGIPNEPAQKVGIKERSQRFGARVAHDALASKALNTGMGAVIGSMAAIFPFAESKDGKEVMVNRNNDMKFASKQEGSEMRPKMENKENSSQSRSCRRR